MIHKLRIALFITFIVLPLTVLNGRAAEGDGKGAAQNQEDKKDATKARIFAKVGDTEISMLEYNFTLRQKAKETFYHGAPPKSEIAKLQREVGQILVDRVFLVREARRQRIAVDPSFVKKQIAVLDEKNSKNKQWKEVRDRVLQQVQRLVEGRALVKLLKKKVIKEIPEPAEEEVRKFYNANNDLFTEPEKVQASVIILKVDPSADALVWEDTRQQATELISRIGKGEDFAKLAKEFSGDRSAENGGDLGFIHSGVLGSVSQQEFDRLTQGEYSKEPVQLLEGFALLKRGKTIKPKLHKFEDVKERAKKLLMRDLEKSTWKELKASLSKGVKVEMNDDFYLPLEGGKGKNGVN